MPHKEHCCILKKAPKPRLIQWNYPAYCSSKICYISISNLRIMSSDRRFPRFITYLNRVYWWVFIKCKVLNYSNPSASEWGDRFGLFSFPVNLANIDLHKIRLWTSVLHFPPTLDKIVLCLYTKDKKVLYKFVTYLTILMLCWSTTYFIAFIKVIIK